MVSMNKSFLYGISFASVTWIISIYLYSQLSKHDHSITTSDGAQSPYSFNEISSHNTPDLKASKYVNSRKLIEKLQPVRKSSRNTTDPLMEELIDLGMVRTIEDQNMKDEGYKIHAYNVLISNKLSYNRSLPDTRNNLCKNITYTEKLPSTTVIICFYNEHFHTLLRTIYSILYRTPGIILSEIVLVDDYSDLPNLHEQIEKHISEHFLNKVKLYKTERREGLIRARMFGARKANSEVIVFLDSHVEVNVNWLPPLLARIKEKRSNVVMPIIDIINPDTFVYTSSPLVRGGFNWGLHFKWENLPKGTLTNKEDFVKPIKSPTMAGGLFAINRKYFIDIGEYDAGMNIWGGENLELSFRIWMCGGSLELIPCSRVGHIFRHRRPYGSPDGQDTMLYNSLRVAHVWMDDYKQYFLNHRKDSKSIDYGDITSRIQLRKELKCNDFNWFVKNIYPELTLPTDDETRLKKKWSALEHDKFQPWHLRKRNYIDQFQIRLSNTSLCIQSAKNTKSKGSSLILKTCTKAQHQMWFKTDKDELVLDRLLCLQAAKPGPILYKCHEVGADQEWKHKDGKRSAIYNIGAGTCLGVKKKEENATIVMKLCTDPTLTMWDFI